MLRTLTRQATATLNHTILPGAAPVFAPTIPKACSIKASKAEVRQGRLSERNLELAVRHLHQDGLVVVEDVIEHDVIDHLNGKMVDDALLLSGRGENSPFNYNKSNLQQDAPPIRKYFSPSIFLNPIASQITTTMLGPKPKLTFCSGNTAMPPSEEIKPQRQPVHSDADFAHPSHPFALVVNVPLITMTPKNGSTEVWLGTHSGSGLHCQEGAHGDRASGRIKLDLLEARRSVSSPIQPEIPKGSVVVRDLRLWHGGMPNTSKDIRVMLAFIHFAPWYRNQMRMELSNTLNSVIDQEQMLDVRADYISEQEAERRYLERGFGNSYDFSQTP